MIGLDPRKVGGGAGLVDQPGGGVPVQRPAVLAG